MNAYTYYHHDPVFVSQDSNPSGFMCTDGGDPYYNNYTSQGYDQQKPFVSPVTYDPATGIYTQTFPEEHHEFLRKFGQYIEFPEDECPPPPPPQQQQQQQQQHGWTYQDAYSNLQTGQPAGFLYNPPSYQTQSPPVFTPSSSSLLSDEDAALMMQYIASPVLASPAVPHPYISSATAAPALEDVKPQLQLQQQAPYVPTTPVQKVEAEEEIIQPHTIVPSQRSPGAYETGLHRRHSDCFLNKPSTGSWMKHLPYQDTSVTKPCIPVTPTQLPSTPTQHRQLQPSPATSPTHSLHPAPDVVSPATSPESCESPNSDHRRHSHSHSPKTKYRAISRSWSPSRQSPSPHASNLGMRLSPLPYSRRAPAIMDKKPPLACLFCRGRKIACGPPPPGRTDNTCNQCARRNLKCEYPTESRRGIRRRKAEKAEKAKVSLVKASRKRATR